eukprot:TRINITY_DN686_c0_g3_i1.p1 TRINITY_DN686_c0_g3~~TRINITY_DN686_c0_g3_i1.p1  ORF type:complete len:293 (+),score=39.53 TRINITY_DN686_c0_g3_i1:96-974(+)
MKNEMDLGEHNKGFEQELEIMKKDINELRDSITTLTKIPIIMKRKEIELVVQNNIEQIKTRLTEQITTFIESKLKELLHKSNNTANTKESTKSKCSSPLATPALEDKGKTVQDSIESTTITSTNFQKQQAKNDTVSSHINISYSLPGSKSTVVTMCRDSSLGLLDCKEQFFSQQHKNQVNFSKAEIKSLCNEVIKENVPTMADVERLKYESKLTNKLIGDLKAEVYSCLPNRINSSGKECKRLRRCVASIAQQYFWPTVSLCTWKTGRAKYRRATTRSEAIPRSRWKCTLQK